MDDRRMAEGELDHWNQNKDDNRFENFRPATHAQNLQNCGPRAHNTSGFKGVSWLRNAGKWSATIRVDGKKIHLGLFDDPVYAAVAYARAAFKYHGEFAAL
jgi:hypothetical protein